MIGILRGVATLVLLVLFIALVVWAWSGRRKKDFDAMARLALDEDREPKTGSRTEKTGSRTEEGNHE